MCFVIKTYYLYLYNLLLLVKKANEDVILLCLCDMKDALKKADVNEKNEEVRERTKPIRNSIIKREHDMTVMTGFIVHQKYLAWLAHKSYYYYSFFSVSLTYSCSNQKYTF